eukprot:g51461.t1
MCFIYINAIQEAIGNRHEDTNKLLEEAPQFPSTPLCFMVLMNSSVRPLANVNMSSRGANDPRDNSLIEGEVEEEVYYRPEGAQEERHSLQEAGEQERHSLQQTEFATVPLQNIELTPLQPNISNSENNSQNNSQSNSENTPRQISDELAPLQPNSNQLPYRGPSEHQDYEQDYADGLAFEPVEDGDEYYDDERQVPIEMPSHRPYFTLLAILVCCAMFVWEMSVANWKFQPLSQNIMLGPSNVVLFECGAKQTYAIVHEGQGWRLISAVFLHAGLIHLGLNMVMLWGIAQRLEEALGFVRVGAVFILSGIFGNILSAIFLPVTIGVGASGAIFGVLGGLLGDYMHNHEYIKQDEKYKYLASLILSSLLGLALGLIPQFDNFGHVGGWTCGIVSSAAFFSGTIKDPHTLKAHHKKGLALCSLTLLIFMYIGGIATLYLVDNPSALCPQCKYLSCVPTPWWSCDEAAGTSASLQLVLKFTTLTMP